MIPLRIATRSSPLAMWQARHVAELLQPHPTELVQIETQGDRIRDRPLSQIGGDGLFTKEIQAAVLDGRADLAVHSLKDLPTAVVPGLTLAAVPPRGPTGDAFLSLRYARLKELPTGATLATSSLRRRSQIAHYRPDLRILDLRGNVETRIRKLHDEKLDAIILAEAGLIRLKLQDHIREILDPVWMLPAVGQGALGIECRTEDLRLRELLATITHRPTHAAVLAERALLRSLGGGCLVPIGALGQVDAQQLHLRGVVLSVDGSQRLQADQTGLSSEAEHLGEQLARRLLDLGAAKLLGRSR